MEQTIQQKRAKFAMDEITSLVNKLTTEQQKNFVSYANSLPAMIHSNGLGQAMAFYKAKGSDKGLAENDAKKRSYNALYKIISDWLCQSPQVFADCRDQSGRSSVLVGITTKDMQSYQLAQAETLVLMSWVKKFAKAFLAEE